MFSLVVGLQGVASLYADNLFDVSCGFFSVV